MTWDVVNDSDKMWVLAFKKKYVRNINFMKMPILKGASWASQSIFECKKVINPWVPNKPGFIPQKRSGNSTDVHLVADLINQDTRQWDRGLDEESVKDFQLYATILCDHLWMARNKARVEGSKSDPTDLSRQILRVFMEHKEAWKEQNERPSKDVVWSPLPRSWIKINFDAAICEEKTTVVVVGRDTTNNLLLAWSEQFESGNSLLGEVKAAWYAMRCAVNEGFQNIILEGDAWNVIELLKKSDVAPHWSIRLSYVYLMWKRLGREPLINAKVTTSVILIISGGFLRSEREGCWLGVDGEVEVETHGGGAASESEAVRVGETVQVMA
ncbi:hypothetical protein SO802_032775 [Lithocarpus litseifolius]|uniref:RNase H type-1 domain-containing protein n=1 Tax=Lithocarpus litseifolius TaxID=425828 RepID=A0AAW2BGK7_9ROSI